MRLVRDTRWVASQLRERLDLLRGRLAVFTYHRVCEPGDHAFLQQSGVPHVTPAVFREQLRFLVEHDFRVLSFREALERFEAGRAFEPRSALITFDDGYRDNLSAAAPVLVELGLPATVFVATRVLAQGELLWEHRVLLALAEFSAREFAQLAGDLLDLDRRPPGPWIVLAGRRPDLATRLRLGERLADALRETGVDESRLARELYLGADDLTELLAAGVEIGSHGAAHHHLTALSSAEKEADLLEAGATLSARLGPGWLPVYCSPYGSQRRGDCELLLRHGYRAAVTERFGTNSRRCDPYFLRRVSLGEPSWPRLRFLERSADLAAKFDAGR
jgi:peptidoglycan/xylan/chitin deacetylase (PgdA/CDA1 family)